MQVVMKVKSFGNAFLAEIPPNVVKTLGLKDGDGLKVEIKADSKVKLEDIRKGMRTATGTMSDAAKLGRTAKDLGGLLKGFRR